MTIAAKHQALRVWFTADEHLDLERLRGSFAVARDELVTTGHFQQVDTPEGYDWGPRTVGGFFRISGAG